MYSKEKWRVTINKCPTRRTKIYPKKLAISLQSYHIKVLEKEGIKNNISHGFEKNKSIITNAKPHVNKRFVLNLDLKNFFESFHFGRVLGFFEKNRYFQLSREVSIAIAQLSCFNGSLPQGASTSPVITNLMFQIFDYRISMIAKKFHLTYTRYADDLTFSTNDKKFIEAECAFLEELEKNILSCGFSINKKKTRLQFRDSQQKVTGLVVNKKVNIDREYYRTTCAMANSLYTNNSFQIENQKGEISQLEGRFAFINQVLCCKTNHKNITKMIGREKQFQRFLYFKYFFNNPKPLIVTEGKTDIKYLKAALKNLHSYYPKLIKKIDESKYEFKISFLSRNSMLDRYLGIKEYGADTMVNIYKCYAKHNGLNLLEYFNQRRSELAFNPVILLFDNELSNKTKPLSKFLKSIEVNDKHRDEFKEIFNIKLFQDGNLFLVTNPLINGKQESEIEDLFTPETQNIILGGKTFSRNQSDFNIDKNYGKEYFANYIYSNYSSIDFEGFKELLDIINSII